jgi:YHS domain-containing protein
MAQLVKDLVCGMMIDPKESAGKSEYQGATYYFCAVACKRDFDADPEKYLGGSAAQAGAGGATRRWWEFWKSSTD